MIKKIEELVVTRKLIDDNAGLLYIDNNGTDIGAFTQKIILEKNIVDYDKIKKECVGYIRALSTKVFESFNSNDIKPNILAASKHIGEVGRIGIGNILLLNKKTSEKYDLDDVLETVMYDDSISESEIFIYRKNSIEQPGLIYCYNDDKYMFVDIGFFPQKQYAKIVIL
jgi:hypothetical protein